MSRRMIISLALIVLFLSGLACNAITGQIEQTVQDGLEQALSTVVPGGELPTLQAAIEEIATQATSGDLQSTLEAAMTQIPEAGSTLESVITPNPDAFNTLPADFPKYTGPITQTFEMMGVITFITSTPFAEVSSFYQQAFQEGGWSPNSMFSMQDTTTSTNLYEKDGRSFMVSISSIDGGNTTVVITPFEMP